MTLRTSVALLAACLLAASSAHARTGANPDGRSPLSLDGRRAAAQLSLQPQVTAFVPAPLPAGAEVVDSTWYDLQDMGSLGRRIVVAADGTVHVTFEKDFCELGTCPPNLSAPIPFPYRAMGYARRVNGVWSHLGKVQDPTLWGGCNSIPDHAGGFGTISLNAAGRAAISQHMNEDGFDLRGDFYLEDAPAGSTWTGYLTPSSDYDFPQVTANPNGSYTVLAEIPQAGSYRETAAIAVSYLAAAGTHFTCPVGWQLGNWVSFAPTSLFRDGQPAFPSLAVSSNGRVGVAVGDLGGNVYLIESSDGTFNAATVVIRKITNYTDATITAPDSTSTQYRSYVNCYLAYNDTTPHVVWSEVQARNQGGTIIYADYHSRIMHWDPIRGVEVVKQVACGEADHYDDVDNGLSGPLCGTNHITVDWPQVGFSADGFETYVAWERFVDAEVDPTADMDLPGVCTGVGFGDIACSVTRPGEGWSAPQDLTNTPSTDERYFSLAARNPGGKAHLVFQASALNQAGCAIFNDRGTNPGNVLRRIVYLEAPLAASLVAVGDAPRLTPHTMLAVPNPANSRVRFAFDGVAARPGSAVEVFSLSGRRVARSAMRPDGSFEWDGRDGDGRRAAAGVYFARLAGDPRVRPARFTLLP